MTSPAPQPIVHLRVNRDALRTWCGRLVAQQDHVHSWGDPIDKLVPGGRVCQMCTKSRAKHFRELSPW